MRQCPHYAVGNWKPSFISTVRPAVHTNPPRKQSFLKTLFYLEEFGNAIFVFSWGRKTICKRNFSKTMAKHLMRFQSDTSVFKFPRRRVDRTWVIHQRYTCFISLCKFLCRAVQITKLSWFSKTWTLNARFHMYLTGIGRYLCKGWFWRSTVLDNCDVLNQNINYLKWFSFECRKVVGFVLTTLHDSL